MDQRSKFSIRGLKTEFVGEVQTNPEAERAILKGDIQLVYISPESIINNSKFRKMLLSPVYKDNLVALVVDEAHCVKTWGDSFRIAFAEIGTLRSLVSQKVGIMALTATATHDTLEVVKERLAMEEPNIVALSPQRPNIIYKVKPSMSLNQLSSSVVEELTEKRSDFPKTIIFIRTYRDCSNLYSVIRFKMGINFTEPPNYPNLSEFRMVEMYSRVSTPEKREDIIASFTNTNSVLRLIIATIAFGMGIDCPDIRRIMHWGLPSDREEYVQESGRAGRDGGDAEAILFEGKVGQHASEAMKTYVKNTTVCRRKLLFNRFISYSDSDVHIIQCKCCDICASSCECPDCKTTK